MRAVLFTVLCACVPIRAAAQGLQFDAGTVFRSGAPDLTSFRAAYTMPVGGPIRWGVAGEVMYDHGSSPVQRWGAGIDLTGWRGGRGPFAALSIDGGFELNGPDDTWASWSAGAGYDFRLTGGLTLGGDVRYRGFFDKEPGGVQVSVSAVFWWRRKTKTAPPPAAVPDVVSTPGAIPPETPVAPAAEAGTIEAGVVAAARQALGKPYLYGGTGQGDDGFDCSGLIQYAYAQQGISLPRVSTSQATEGFAVPKLVGALEPGDILTFASQPGGKKVSHVGLYLGDGRFIHSASSRGVMESSLSGTDPNGQWWFVRWVGARRVIKE